MDPGASYTRHSRANRETEPIAIVSVDTAARPPIAVGIMRTRQYVNIDISHYVGAVQVTPAVGEQWMIIRDKGIWKLDQQLPFNVPSTLETTVPGQVKVGGSGPLTLSGTEIQFKAPLRLSNTLYRDSEGVLEKSQDEGNTWTIVSGTQSKSVKDFGAKGDGISDDTSAIALAMSANVPLRFPPGTYLTSQKINQGNFSVVFEPGVTIKATATMEALWQVGSATVRPINRSLIGSDTVFDCDDKAQVGLSLYSYERFTASNLHINQTALHGVVVGDPGASLSCYEGLLTDIHTTRRKPWVSGTTALAPPIGGRGLWIRNAGDGEYNRMILVGNETGVYVDTGGNRFNQIHVWGYENYIPAICFHDKQDNNTWTACVADSPGQFGWKLEGLYTTIVAGQALLASWQTDNTVVAVTATQSVPSFTIVGFRIKGMPGVRFKNDFTGYGQLAGTDGCTILGVDREHVITQTFSQRNYIAGLTMYRNMLSIVNSQGITGGLAFRVAGPDATYGSIDFMSVNTNIFTRKVEFPNAAILTGYSDNYSTEKWRMGGTYGSIQAAKYSTNNRPSASTLGAGHQIYDTTLKKPIWSDGTDWRDAAGSIA